MINQSNPDEILDKIKSSNKILLTSHTNPDMDSTGSVLSFYQFLIQLGKNKIDIVFTDSIPKDFSFLPFSDKIRQKEISAEDLTNYDLVVFLDSATLQRTTRATETLSIKGIFSINIDHHETNEKFASLNLVEVSSSTCELLYCLYKHWKIKISQDMALCLLTGITGDTNWFQYVENKSTFLIASELVGLGASPKEISFYTLKNLPLDKLKFWGSCFLKADIVKIDNIKYVWTAVCFDELIRAGGRDLRQGVESFFSIIEDTDFGILITEQEEGILSGSLRARTINFDVSIAALALGGGGHKGAAGFKFKLDNLTFQQGVKKIHDLLKKTYNK